MHISHGKNGVEGAEDAPKHTFSSLKVKVLVTQLYPNLCSPMVCPQNSPGKNTGVGCHSLLRGIFPTRRSNSGLLLYRKILYHLSYQGSPFSSLQSKQGAYWGFYSPEIVEGLGATPCAFCPALHQQVPHVFDLRIPASCLEQSALSLDFWKVQIAKHF